MIRKIYFMGGLNGSGKSEILKVLAKNTKDIGIISGSKYFMEWLGIERNNYEKLESLSDALKDRELEKMMKQIVQKKQLKSHYTIVDGHYFRIRNNGLVPCIGDWISLMDGLITIIANPKEILFRIERDTISKKRKRNLFLDHLSEKEKIEELGKRVEKNVKFANMLSKEYNIRNIVIENKEGQWEDAAKKVALFLKN